MSKLAKLFAILVCTALLAAGCTGSSNQPSSSARAQSVETKPEVGFAAPDFTLTDLGGNTVQLSALKGQPVLINFWASWCPPCRAEMPDLQNAYEVYGSKVKFLMVNLASSEKGDAGRAYIEQHKFTFPVLLDTDEQAATLYRIRAIPTTYFVDRDGIIQAKVTGALTASSLEDNLKKIR